ncbi:Protein of unknown function [Colwellia chukchiensis]|uniref:DUF3530 domain-containing protein n=1 Tax=Colwellia chukchiensis TaxID=641665 RepID=A0A1H7TBE7_9GAMM|nr:DUF3530 family protein [Colwellia chukchiensis]SEL82171.1 Protein of unknown function [Colwellia chukchiensis]
MPDKNTPIYICYFFSLLLLLIHSPKILANDNPLQSSNAQQQTGETPAPNANKQPSDTNKQADDHSHQVIIEPPLDAFNLQQQDIEHFLTSEAVTPLLVGDEKYITLIKEHTTAINQGVMVLIPDWQQGIVSPNALTQLQQNLPGLGWTTITLHPPHQPQNYPSQALTATERQDENREKLASYSKKLAAIMHAVLNKAQNYPGVIVIVAEGNHSAILLDIYQQGIVQPPAAMVLLSSYMPTTAASAKLSQHVAAANYPLLDLYLQRDNRLVLMQAKQRLAAAKRSMKVDYRQKQINNQITAYYPKSGLSKEILSWLSSLGW